MLRSLGLAAIAGAGIAHAQITNEFTGRGHIMVLNTSSIMTAELGHYIGCLDASGALTESNCAIFTRSDDEPHVVSTSQGNCSFANAAMPTNTDSYYGDRNHAWSCTAANIVQDMDRLYTIDGLDYPYLCNRDISCYYDAKRAPNKDEELPVWQFSWGSLQMGITPGHIQLAWMWAPLDETDETAE